MNALGRRLHLWSAGHMHSSRRRNHQHQRQHPPHIAIDSMLRSGEKSVMVQDGAVSKVEISQLAANTPVEDFFAAAKCPSSDAHLFGVFDGHAGPACARHVSDHLFDYLCAAVLEKHRVKDTQMNENLEWIFSSIYQNMQPSVAEEHAHTKNIERFRESLRSHPDMGTVRKAIQSAFLAFDHDVSESAMPDGHGHVDRMRVSIAASGSCSLVSHVRRKHLHVANIGDSTAVLGVVSSHGAAFNALQLTRPHTVENVNEIRRIRTEHPAEINTVLKGGRLLGELYPLRAFGDIRYKWPAALQKIVLEPLGVPPPPDLHTPPYLSARPEVRYRLLPCVLWITARFRLTANDRFLVLATDGLWEFLDPDTVVRLIADHTIGTQTLGTYDPKAEHNLGDILSQLEYRRRGERKRPLDANSATHVIRNALGGISGGMEQQYEHLRETLQLPAGSARQFRDDITVMVIHFDEEYLSQQQPA